MSPLYPFLRSTTRHYGRLLLAVLLLALIAAAPVSAQIVEEDLPAFDDSLGVDPETYANYEDAVSLIYSPEQDRAFALFTRVIDRVLLMSPSERTEGSDEILLKSLAYRADIQFKQGNQGLAQGDLESIITMQPTHDLDPNEISADLIAIYEELRKRIVGWVQIRVSPGDARLVANKLATTATQADMLEGAPMELVPNVEQPLLAGRYLIQGKRPGFSGQSTTIEIQPGERRSFDLTMARFSATIKLYTQPAGATVVIDGYERGETQIDNDGKASLWIDSINTGPHEVEIRRPGFRTHRARLQVKDLRDYAFKPIVLERQAGSLRLVGFPAGATTTVNGSGVRPRMADDGRSAILPLAPGSYQLNISLPAGGVFETSFDLGDDQTLSIDVRLRSGLALLGVLGKDTVAADKLVADLRSAFDEAQTWTLLDRTEQGRTALDSLGLTAESMRKIIGANPKDAPAIDWSRVQALAQRTSPAQAYAIAVLDDDLLAQEAELWMFPPPPAPSQPDYRVVELTDPATLLEVAAGFAPSLVRRRSSLGAVIIDSELTPAPIVASMNAGGPAATAGLRVGDEITAFAGAPIFTAKQIQDQLEKLPPNQPIQLEIRSHQGSGVTTRTVSVTPKGSLGTLDTSDPRVIKAAAAAELLSALGKQQQDVPRWLMQLNQALLEMQARDWQSAVSTLRKIEAPRSRGLGQATVDYCLGIALTNAGPRYLDAAREAFSRAASTEGRLYSDDGPLVAPRARARLQALGS